MAQSPKNRLLEEAANGNLESFVAIVNECGVKSGERRALLNAKFPDRSPLDNCAAHGHVSIINWLFSAQGGRAEGFEPTFSVLRDSFFFAVKTGQTECCKILIQHASPQEQEMMVNGVDRTKGWSVLRHCATSGHTSLIEWHLSADGGRAFGFDRVLEIVEGHGSTALHIAAKAGHFECLKAIVEGCRVDNGEREKMLNAVDYSDRTALHFAAIANNTAMIKWLVCEGCAQGFNGLSAANYQGFTALHYAALNGNLDAFLAIVNRCRSDNGERKEMLNAANCRGSTILHLASVSNDPSIITWILSDKGGRAEGFDSVLGRTKYGRPTALHYATSIGYLACFKAIFEGCRVENGEREEMLNSIDEADETVLHCAAKDGHTAIVEWLLCDGRSAGFNRVLGRTKNQETAMHLAASEKHLRVCKAIVKGCRSENGERQEMLNAVDGSGQSALDLAVLNNHPSIVLWLLSDKEDGGRSAGFEARSLSSALHLAVENDYIRCARAILDNCSSSQERRNLFLHNNNEKGWTVLHVALTGTEPRTVKCLLQYTDSYIAANMKDKEGMTALHRGVVTRWKGNHPYYVESMLRALMGLCKPRSKKDGAAAATTTATTATATAETETTAATKRKSKRRSKLTIVDPNIGIGLFAQ